MSEKPPFRCYECKYFKPSRGFNPVGRGFSGWCQDAKPKIRVTAIDFCEHQVRKEDC